MTVFLSVSYAKVRTFFVVTPKKLKSSQINYARITQEMQILSDKYRINLI